jgi:hypothetical protein
MEVEQLKRSVGTCVDLLKISSQDLAYSSLQRRKPLAACASLLP